MEVVKSTSKCVTKTSLFSTDKLIFSIFLLLYWKKSVCVDIRFVLNTMEDNSRNIYMDI